MHIPCWEAAFFFFFKVRLPQEEAEKSDLKHSQLTCFFKSLPPMGKCANNGVGGGKRWLILKIKDMKSASNKG